MLQITTPTVWSEVVNTEDAPEELTKRLPGDWLLSTHQVETLRYYNDPSVDVVFNIAMTGDGKTLAAYLPVLAGEPDKYSTIGMYPTHYCPIKLF